MSGKLPPLNALAAFEAAARSLSFVKAAQELHITSSAVSHRIKLLEKHYGMRLFLRKSTALALTDEGKIFLESVLDVLSILKATSSRIANRARKQVTINVAHSFANKWLVDKLDDFHDHQPQIDLEIRAITIANPKRLPDLRSGEVDVAIRYGLASDWDGFESIELMPIELFPVCSPHYLSKFGAPVNVDDLAKGVLLHSAREPWSLWFKAAGVKTPPPRQGPTFSDAALLLSAAISGQGIALARDVLVNRDLETGRVVRLFDISAPSTSGYHAIFMRRTVRPEVNAFVQWLIQKCRAEAAAVRPTG